MRKCSNCGIDLPENAKFCPDCGAPYMPDEGVASAEPEGPQKNICEKCGLELPASAKFCTVCGGKAIMGSAVVAPTKGSFSGAKTVSDGGIMMESVSREDIEKESTDEAPEAAPMGEMGGAIPEMGGAIPEMGGAIPEMGGAIPEMGGAIPEMGGAIPEMGTAPKVGDMGAIPEMREMGVIPEVSDTPKASVTMPGVSVLPQTASPVSQPVEPSRPVSAVSQPITASQPISASPILPSVSGTGTAVMQNPAPVNNANTLNPNIQSGAMPTYNAQPTAPGVNLAKGSGTQVLPNNAPLGATGAPGASGSPAFGTPIPQGNFGAQGFPNNPVATGAFGATGATGATAVPTRPVKKKMSIGGKIGIIAGSLVAAAAVAAGVFFAVDKATFLSTVMGKEKYAVMVESKAITNAASMIDTQSISDGVGAVSEVFASLATIGAIEDMPGEIAGDIEDMSGTVPMMNPAMSSSGSVPQIDMAAYIKSVNELYLKTYGVNSLKENVSVEVEAGDSLKALIGEDEAMVDEIVKLINNTQIGCNVIADEDAMQVDYNVTLDQAAVDCKVLVNSNNEMYLALPFVSDKAFLVKLPAPTEETEETPVLQLDKAELERIIKSIVESYLMNYKAAAIEMEKGSVEIAGEKIEGKAITAEFKGDSLKKLFTDAVEIIAKDEYLKTEIVNYCKEIGMEDMTAEKYESEIMEAVEFDETDGDRLVITSIIDKQGNILARYFEAFSDTSDETPTMGYFANDKQAAFEMVFGGDGKFTVKADIKSATDFDMAINIEYDSDVDKQEIALNINCTGVKVEKFGSREVPVGTYVLSVQLPDEFEDQLGGGAETLAAINDMTLTLSTAVSGSTQTGYVRLDAASYGSVQFNTSVTAENDTVGEYPTNVIDLTPVIEQGTPDNDTMEQLKAYLDEVGTAYEDIRSKLSGYSIFAGLPEFTNPLDQPERPSHGDDDLTLDALAQYITGDVQALDQYAKLVDPSDTGMINRIAELQKKYVSLDLTVAALSTMSEEDTEGYAENLKELEDKYWELFDELLEIEIEITGSSGGGSMQQPVLPEVDLKSIDKKGPEEVQALMDAYNAVFEPIQSNKGTLITNSNLEKLYEEAEEQYDDVKKDWEYFDLDYKRGNTNLALLRNVKASLKKYIPAVQALVEALEAEGLM